MLSEWTLIMYFLDGDIFFNTCALNLFPGKVFLTKFGIWLLHGTSYGTDSACGPHLQEEELIQGSFLIYTFNAGSIST